MDIISNIKLFGKLESNSFRYTETLTHELTSTDINYSLVTTTHIKHIVDLTNAPDNVTIDLKGGVSGELLGIVELIQPSVGTPKIVNWGNTSSVDFDTWKGELGKTKTFIYHFNGNVFRSLISKAPVANELIYSTKSLSTTGSAMDVSLEDDTVSTINATQDSAISFTNLGGLGKEYLIYINVFNESVITFPNLINDLDEDLVIGDGKNILKITYDSIGDNVYLLSKNTRPPISIDTTYKFTQNLSIPFRESNTLTLSEMGMIAITLDGVTDNISSFSNISIEVSDGVYSRFVITYPIGDVLNYTVDFSPINFIIQGSGSLDSYDVSATQEGIVMLS